MLEERLRETFAHHEAAVPSAAPLVDRIDRAARRKRRQHLSTGAAALGILLVAVGLPALLSRPTETVPLLASPWRDSVPAGPLNFALIGHDRLPSSPAGQPISADVILIAHVPADRSAIQLVSIPRAVLVPSPSGNGETTISSTYGQGGLEQLKRSLQDLTGVQLNGSVTVGLDGLRDLVDQVGGVDYCMDQPTTSIHTGVTYPVGCALRTGAELRDLLRQRKDLPNGVLDRDRHNGQFLVALAKRLRSGSTLTDPVAMTALVRTLSQHVEISAGGIDAVDLLWSLRDAPMVYGGASWRSDPASSGRYLLPGDSATSMFAALRADQLGEWIAAQSTNGTLLDE